MWGSGWGKQSISILPLMANTKLRTTLLLERKHGKNMLVDLADVQGMLKPIFSKFKENEQATIHHLMSLFAVVILMTST